MNALAPSPTGHAGIERVGGSTPAAAVATVAFVLLRGFDLLSLMAGSEPFRQANRLAGEVRFGIRLLSADGAPVLSCQGVEVQVDGALSDRSDADLTVVFGAEELAGPVPPSVPGQMRRLWRMGFRVGAVQGGIFALARAGILGGTRFAAKKEHMALLALRWPELAPQDRLYSIENRILTCVGGVSAADLSLRVIRDLAGAEAAHEAMRACRMSSVRDEATPQSPPLAGQVTSRSACLRRALRWIEENYAQEDCLAALPDAAGTSARHLQRLFKTHLGMRPLQYLLDLRLDRARLLLSESDLAVQDVAEACGFGSGGRFAKHFRQKFGVTPSRFSPLAASEGQAR